jgi:hypothetical protein
MVLNDENDYFQSGTQAAVGRSFPELVESVEWVEPVGATLPARHNINNQKPTIHNRHSHTASILHAPTGLPVQSMSSGSELHCAEAEN